MTSHRRYIVPTCKSCESIAIGRGLCRRHYLQEWSAGLLDNHQRKCDVVTVKDRLLSKIRITESGCWEWIGFRKPDKFDYGYIWINGRNVKAHRVSYEQHKGPIPKGIDVLHKCDNPPCINPDHLFLGTRGENCKDCASKNRFPLNESHHNAKLSKEDIRTIFSLRESMSQTEIARQFGVNQSHISRI